MINHGRIEHLVLKYGFQKHAKQSLILLLTFIIASSFMEKSSRAHPYQVFNFFKAKVAAGFFQLTNTAASTTTSDMTSSLQANSSTIGSKIVFCGTNSSGKGKLFAVDRTSATIPTAATQLLDLNASANDCLTNTQISIKYNGKVYVVLTNGSTPTAYVYDGFNTPVTAWPVSTATPLDTTIFAKAAVYGGILYFTANNSSGLKKYFSFDGTTLAQISNINPATNDVTISNKLFVAYNQVFLTGFVPGSTTVLKLWRYCDGISGCGSAGMNIVNMYGSTASPAASSDISNLDVITSAGGVVYLVMKDFTTRTANKLHSIQSDLVIRRIAVDFSGASTTSDTIAKLTAVSSSLYAVATNSSGGSKLWSVDTVTPSITSISNLAAAASSDSIGGITLFNSQIYFSAKPTGGLPGVWRVSGTSPVSIVTGGTLSVDPFIFAGNLYFADGSANVVKLNSSAVLSTASTALKFKSSVFVDGVMTTDGNSMYFLCVGTFNSIAFNGTKICTYSP
jgi:hypothetical protein